MHFLVAEVMDKAPASFAAAIAIAGVTAPTCAIFGRLAPRPVTVIALAVTVVFGAILVALDHDDVVYDYARAEAGRRGVALYAQHHVLWVGPLLGLLVGLTMSRLAGEGYTSSSSGSATTSGSPGSSTATADASSSSSSSS